MKKSELFKPAFLVSIISSFVGASMKIMHIPAGNILMGISFLATVVFIISALYEVFRSNRLAVNEKIMWTIGFLVLSILTGILYYFLGRPRLFRQYKVLNNYVMS